VPRKLERCNLCGKSLPRPEVAARASVQDFPDLVWCFDCWDWDERAVMQYRNVGTPTVTGDAAVNEARA
jgi:hypothetical protein